jgi:hypothetical protein
MTYYNITNFLQEKNTMNTQNIYGEKFTDVVLFSGIVPTNMQLNIAATERAIEALLQKLTAECMANLGYASNTTDPAELQNAKNLAWERLWETGLNKSCYVWKNK